MPGNAIFLQCTATNAWLSQFAPAEQEPMRAMLRAMKLVSADEFKDELKGLILRRIDSDAVPVGLYAERELKKRSGVVHRLFHETKTRHRRAYGIGPGAVEPKFRYNQEVGSEGIVAQLISEVCKECRKVAFSHPGPDKIRKKCIRRFIVITDFIGSGSRVREYLDAAWKVRSVRSWWSTRKRKGMSLEVIAYSATQRGLENVKAHPSSPVVSQVIACPTVSSITPARTRDAIISACRVRDPTGVPSESSLGFKGVGALVAFSHGAPNNVPKVLIERRKGWLPLFPERITSATFRGASDGLRTEWEIRAALIALRQKRIAASPLLSTIAHKNRKELLLLASLGCSPRSDTVLSVRSGLTIFEIQSLLDGARKNGWIDQKRRLTDAGQAQLRYIRRFHLAGRPPLPKVDCYGYHPTQLRAPVVLSSSSGRGRISRVAGTSGAARKRDADYGAPMA